MSNTPVRNVRVDDELWEAAMAKAGEDGVSLSEIIRGLLVLYVHGEQAIVGAGHSLLLRGQVLHRGQVPVPQFATRWCRIPGCRDVLSQPHNEHWVLNSENRWVPPEEAMEAAHG